MAAVAAVKTDKNGKIVAPKEGAKKES